jgi:hypothetical protein
MLRVLDIILIIIHCKSNSQLCTCLVKSALSVYSEPTVEIARGG